MTGDSEQPLDLGDLTHPAQPEATPHRSHRWLVLGSVGGLVLVVAGIGATFLGSEQWSVALEDVPDTGVDLTAVADLVVAAYPATSATAYDTDDGDRLWTVEPEQPDDADVYVSGGVAAADRVYLREISLGESVDG